MMQYCIILGASNILPYVYPKYWDKEASPFIAPYKVEALLMNNHNICFCGEKRTIIKFWWKEKKKWRYDLKNLSTTLKNLTLNSDL